MKGPQRIGGGPGIAIRRRNCVWGAAPQALRARPPGPARARFPSCTPGPRSSPSCITRGLSPAGCVLQTSTIAFSCVPPMAWIGGQEKRAFLPHPLPWAAVGLLCGSSSGKWGPCGFGFTGVTVVPELHELCLLPWGSRDALLLLTSGLASLMQPLDCIQFLLLQKHKGARFPGWT